MILLDRSEWLAAAKREATQQELRQKK